jgi:hypothetical protein
VKKACDDYVRRRKTKRSLLKRKTKQPERKYYIHNKKKYIIAPEKEKYNRYLISLGR